MAANTEVGREAEARAEEYLRREGLHTVTRNFRCRSGEIDLIMRDGDHLVFVEVRYRSHSAYGGAAASVDRNKQQSLIRSAQSYLQANRWSGPCRFDVVAFGKGQEKAWIRDAFGA